MSEKTIDLLSYLPAIYRDDAFLGRYLQAFEDIFLALDQAIDGIPAMFEPKETREEFLPWLSSWLGFALRADLTVEQRRAFLSRIVPLYRRRGTKENLAELLGIFVNGGVPTITEYADEMQIGALTDLGNGVKRIVSGKATIGVDTLLGSAIPHHFRVTMRLPHAESSVQWRKSAIARAIIELEKPAHTSYELIMEYPSMKIGIASTIGVDTLLGTN